MGSAPIEETKYDVCFIESENPSEETTKILESAYEAMQTNHLKPIWINVEDCIKMSRNDSSKLFIMDPFEGVAFEHLKILKCRIVGPLSILYCFQHRNALPLRPYPVYSVSMRKITICCSDVKKQDRDEICVKVQKMGGFFSKHLTISVTHLVVDKVGSQKYKVASRTGLPIMTPEWIIDLWENGQHKLLHASDSFYKKYKCAVFRGLTISVSAASDKESCILKKIIERNGGLYSKSLKADKITHLVISVPFGDKCHFEKNWKVTCVNVNWIFDSVKTGYCQDEALYAVGDPTENS